MGWVTPLGSDLTGVWQRLLNGETAPVQSISSPLGRDYPVIPVPADQTPAHPRLRRSSAISRFAVTAGLAAVKDAGLDLDPETAARTALIFAVSNGGVIYTKRFYDQIVESGAHTASPLLFPETVFNAPASHIAALLGSTAVNYTLVGDSGMFLQGLALGASWLSEGRVDGCLVIGAEEVDWVSTDAFLRFERKGEVTVRAPGDVVGASRNLKMWQAALANVEFGDRGI
jgi:3-oxoacyl-(acyl-carrier-protein) synthase